MLVLTRQPNAGHRSIITFTLSTGETIEIIVQAVRDGQVRLGIAAPRDLPVHRAEIYAEIQAENAREAALWPLIRQIDAASLPPEK